MLKKIIIETLFWVICFQNFLMAQKKDVPSTFYEDTEVERWKNDLVGKAQNYVGIWGGVAVPQGEYAAIVTRQRAGFAQIGGGVQVSSAFFGKKNVGLALALGGIFNPINAGAYNAEYKEVLPNVQFSSSTGDSWMHAYAAAGLCVSIPENRFSIDLKLMSGAMYSILPKRTYSGILPNNDSFIHNRVKNTSIAPLFLGGFSFNYILSPTLVFFGECNYIVSLQTFDIKETLSTLNNGLMWESNAVAKQPVKNFLVGIGIKRLLSWR